MLQYLAILFTLMISMHISAQKQSVQIESGKTLAKKCIDCHSTKKDALADPLKGIRKIRTPDYINKLMKNPMHFADENKTAKRVFAKRGLQMPPFPELSKEDIKVILDYFDSIPNKKN